MAAWLADAEVSRSLADALNCNDEDRAWLGNLLELFPCPTAGHVHHLIFALARLRDATVWWPELVGQEEFISPLGRVEAGLREAIDSKRLTPAAEAGRRGSSFTGDYLRTATLLSDRKSPPSSLECLRAILVGCAWRWRQSGKPRQTAVDDLAGAIRGVVRAVPGEKPGIPDRVLFDLGDMLLAPALVPPSRVDGSDATQAFAEAWNRHVVPEIESVLAKPGPVEPLPSGEPRPPGIKPDPKGRPRQKQLPSLEGAAWNDDPSLRRQAQSYRRRLAALAPGSEIEIEPGESPEEAIVSLDLLAAESVPRNPDAAGVARYQVQQAIWNRNSLLTTNHPDVVPLDRLRAGCGLLLESLTAPECPAAVRPGRVGLLLQALAGRTAKSLTTLCIAPDAFHPHDPRGFDFLVKEGALRFSVFWQVGREEGEDRAFFKPSDDATLHLEPSGTVYCLPLLPAVADVLRQNTGALETLTAISPEEVAGHLREAAAWLTERLGWPVMSGQVRASFSAHLFEQCRDQALTQLIAADSLGGSTAPASYYAPTVSTLAAAILAYQQAVLPGDHPMPQLADQEERVGSRLFVTKSSAVGMARAMGAPFRQGVIRMVAQGKARQVHQGMVVQMTGMLVGALTHRPTSALLTLSRSDFLIERACGAALFRDKVIDGAHDPRLVVLPPTACRQFEVYLEHLAGLAKLRPTLEPHIRGVLAGDQPLFFAWDGEGGVEPLTLADWKALMPDAWQALPFNWGRHWCRTRAIELGVRPEFVNIQMGHLEAVGYPFSGASPTEPSVFVEALAPLWEGVVRSQGWSVLKGLGGGAEASIRTLPPLRQWSRVVREHLALGQEQARRWRDQQRSQMRSYRARADEEVLANRELVDARISERYANPATGQSPHSFTRADFERLRDELLDGESDVVLGLAKASALCRIARAVNRRTSQRAEDPAPLYFPRRPLDNAFIPGMMLAVSQVRALRDHFNDWSGIHKPGPKDDFTLACARTALALALFGYCDQPEKILGVIANRRAARRSAALKDLLMVPWGAGPGQVVALRGIAAIVVAKLARKYPEAKPPDWNALAGAMQWFLPDWAVGGSASPATDPSALAVALLETAGMAHRFELSPAARIGLAPEGGCIEAHPREQIALFDGDPAGSLEREWLAEDTADDDPPESPTPNPGGMPARSQYLALCRVFPVKDRDTELPLVGRTIPSGEKDDGRHRRHVISEIQAMLDVQEPERRLKPIVRLLAAWCREMLTLGTQRRRTPRYRTIHTYLTRVGGPLVDVFGNRRLDGFDEVELEEAYLAAVDCKSDKQPGAAATILSLHRFGRTHFHLADADLTPLYVLAGKKSDIQADARLVLPSERTRFLQMLDQSAQGDAGKIATSALARNRVSRQARAAGEILVETGLRRSEVLGLEMRNVFEEERRATISVRPNRSRRLKTPSARRNVVIAAAPGTASDWSLLSWKSNEMARLPPSSAGRAYLFAQRERPRSAEGRDDIAQALLKCAKEATGIPSARLHLFRHLSATELVAPIFLSSSDRKCLSMGLSLKPAPSGQGGVALPRDMRTQCIPLGHADPKTTLVWYFHVPVLLRSRPDKALARRHLNVNTLATLLGVTREAMRWSIKQAPGQDPAVTWMDHEAEPRVAPAQLQAADRVGEGTRAGPKNWTATFLAEVLAMTERMRALEPALLAIGADPAVAGLIREAILPIEQRLGRRLLRDGELEKIKNRPKRRVRLVAGATAIEQLLQEFDQDTGGRRSDIAKAARAVCNYMAPLDADRIRLPATLMPGLIEQLAGVGIEPARMKCTPLAAGMSMLRILRGSNDPEATDGVPLDAVASAEANGRSAAGNCVSSQASYLGLVVKRVLAIVDLAAEGPRAPS